MSKSFPYHIGELNRVFSDRRGRNPNYSLRSYARDIGLSPSALSSLLNGKKGISEDRAKLVADKIGLNRSDTKLFLTSVLLHHGRSAVSRGNAKVTLDRLEETKQKRTQLSEDRMALINHWYDFAILELLEIKSSPRHPKMIAARLGITEEVVNESLLNLARADLIELVNGFYEIKSIESETTQDIPSESIRSFHIELLSKAKESVQNQPVHEREFSSITMAFDRSRTKEVKEFLRDFQDEFIQRFYCNSDANDSVYQMCMQFFRLDQSQDHSNV